MFTVSDLFCLALKDGSYFSRHWTKYPYSCSIETLQGPNFRPVNSQCKVKQILCPIGITMFDEFFSKEFFPSSPILKPRSSENKSWVSQVISTPVCVSCCCCCHCCRCLIAVVVVVVVVAVVAVLLVVVVAVVAVLLVVVVAATVFNERVW